MLDPYEGRWEGKWLHAGDLVISADEQPSMHSGRPPVHDHLRPAPASGRGQPLAAVRAP
ncbi:MAG TPA: hypothetical protein VGV57_07940 [Thermoleophilaceae bacterium]|nr:hypothetical protein [Thermoleophilaceae bacterium]